MRAGEVFEVTVTISKGALTDYSRFSQDLPLGLTATNISSPNADFSFDNQRIRIIWLKLPEESEIKVSYNIMVNERLSGKFVLGVFLLKRDMSHNHECKNREEIFVTYDELASYGMPGVKVNRSRDLVPTLTTY